MGMHKVLIILTILPLLVSCQEDDKVLHRVFMRLKQQIQERELYTFKNAPIDSAAFYSGYFYYEYKEVIDQNVLPDDEVMRYLENLQIQNFNFPDYLYLVYNFHGWLNGKKYSIYDCQEIYERVIEHEQQRIKKTEEEALQIIINNRDRCVVGDTLNLIFPMDNNYWRAGTKEAVLRLYPHSMEIFEFEDTIKLKGILLDKLSDSIDLRFKLYVLELNLEEVLLLGDQYKVGDTLNLPVKSYGRLIN